ncbi:periplasmic sensor hybrid histidine kinase [Magnetococcus marinus MC-1]|uniref:Sensory/regulatory protein RpfC n=1 Tax=Magnetococcus marinus (strain ATCC BAA-1437 / JCM 17883 / MC-1) TaxID=156889 RepID=A0L495_MAGMM|nr:ATP-binding protein [Magnetococcus marinus]ABK42788.1 periplasmic sensor hybrid histidine kinase [Magnetococcus marinus MC-1]
MNIRSIVFLFGFSGSAILAAGIWSFSVSYGEVTALFQRQNIISQITDQGYRLALLTNEVLLQREIRAEQQWLSLYRMLEQFLEKNAAQLTPVQSYVQGIQHSLQNLHQLFERVTEGFKIGPLEGNAYQAQQRLYLLQMSQISIRIAELQTRLGELTNISNDAAEKTAGSSYEGVLFQFGLFLFALILYAVLAILFFYTRLLEPLNRLHKGIQRIQQGDVKHRPSHRVMDELGALFAAFSHLLDELQIAITYRKNNEEHLRQLLKLNEEASHLSERELCDRGLGIVVSLTQSEVGYLHMVHSDQETLTRVTWNHPRMALGHALDDALVFLNQAGVLTDWAAREKPIIQNNKPNFQDDQEVSADRFTFFRHLSVPVIEGNNVRMVMGVGNKAEDYNQNDVRQLQTVANEVGKFVQRRRSEIALRIASDEALKANRAKSDFLAVMSHEIRTPMNAIMGMTELLEETELTTIQRNYLSICRSSGQNLLQLINDILDISKVEAGRMEVAVAPFHLHRIIHDANQVILFRAQEKGLNQIVYIDPAVPTILLGDQARIRQILINFLGNSVKFTQSGTIATLVTTRAHANKEDQLVIHVVDTGIGIEQSEQEAIFKAFHQVDSSNQRQQGGTGLGLAICLKLVALMQGSVSLSSRAGKGSTFTLTLPLTVAPAEQIQSLKVERGLTGYHMVIWHTHPISTLYIEEMFKERGAKVRSCNQSMTLANCAIQGDAVLATTDMMIIHYHEEDKTNPLELINTIRSEQSLHEIPVLVYGRCYDPALLKQLNQLGVRFLPESLMQDVLCEQIVTELSKRPRSAVTSGQGGTLPMHILLVDDSPDNIFLIQAFLKKTSYQISTVYNGKEAVEYVMQADTPPDLILMDIQMPIMDGYAATRQIRLLEQQQGQSRIPIIALTAHAMAEEAEKLKAAGCDLHMAKPVSKRILLEVLGRYHEKMAYS